MRLSLVFQSKQDTPFSTFRKAYEEGELFKNPTRDIDEELLKQRIDEIRTNDPYIYR